jgi:hypothetical protein
MVALLVAGVKPVHAPHAGVGVIVYPVIAEPLLAGAVQLKLTCPDSPVAVAVAANPVDGGASGIAAFDGGEAALVPAPFVAVYVNV